MSAGSSMTYSSPQITQHALPPDVCLDSASDVGWPPPHCFIAPASIGFPVTQDSLSLMSQAYVLWILLP